MSYGDIGPWSEIKLDIIREYASAYSRILNAQNRFEHLYIDAFAGSGAHISRMTGKFVPGSPLNALLVDPPFKEYHLIDIERGKAASLREIVGARSDVSIYEGDCNAILLTDVLPRAKYEDYKRALCLLDPYGLHLNWELIQTTGQMKSIEIFLNFPIGDMNRNVLWRNSDNVDLKQAQRMTAYWGDESWHGAAYVKTPTLFGSDWEMKRTNEAIAKAFRARLKDIAGFAHVPEPIPMRNSMGAALYYLFFASQKPVAASIVKDIFNKYRGKGGA